MALVRQRFPEHAPVDVQAAIASQWPTLATRIRPGQRIALALGSRGITDILPIAQALANAIRQAGATPFIVPSMGSHGGGTPEGQTQLLAEYGITPSALDAPFAAAMDVRTLGTTRTTGMEVVTSEAACQADQILLVNRVKPHTDFRGAIGSGLLKMLVVGLGKAKGAALFHASSSRFGYARVLVEAAEVALAKLPLLGGVAIIEDQRHRTAEIHTVTPENFLQREPELCAHAQALMPRLPWEEIDLLIVDRIGKNISGTGMDPAITGRSVHGYSLAEDEPPRSPHIRRIIVRRLSEQSHGNAIGVGMADFTTNQLQSQVDWRVTSLNVLTALSLQSAKLPLCFEHDREAVERAVGTLAPMPPRELKIVRLRDTLSLEIMEASEACLAPGALPESVDALEQPRPMQFDMDGTMAPIPAAPAG